jgi:hypothetical protein
MRVRTIYLDGALQDLIRELVAFGEVFGGNYMRIVR